MTGLMDLADLIARCEQAEGPDRDLDRQIALHVGWERKWADSDPPLGLYWSMPARGWEWTYEDDEHPPQFSASLDAALTLVPEGWYGRVEPRFYVDGERVGWRGYCVRPKWKEWTPFGDWFDTVEDCDAKTPALALALASLRARAQGA